MTNKQDEDAPCPNGCGQMDWDHDGIGWQCPDCGEFIGGEEPHPSRQPVGVCFECGEETTQVAHYHHWCEACNITWAPADPEDD